jgi:hypothetical protein
MTKRTHFKFIKSAMLQRLSSFRGEGDQCSARWEIGRRVSTSPAPPRRPLGINAALLGVGGRDHGCQSTEDETRCSSVPIRC